PDDSSRSQIQPVRRLRSSATWESTAPSAAERFVDSFSAVAIVLRIASSRYRASIGGTWSMGEPGSGVHQVRSPRCEAAVIPENVGFRDSRPQATAEASCVELDVVRNVGPDTDSFTELLWIEVRLLVQRDHRVPCSFEVRLALPLDDRH